MGEISSPSRYQDVRTVGCEPRAVADAIPAQAAGNVTLMDFAVSDTPNPGLEPPARTEPSFDKKRLGG